MAMSSLCGSSLIFFLQSFRCSGQRSYLFFFQDLGRSQLLSRNFIQTLMATCCTRSERRLTRMSLRRTKRPFQDLVLFVGEALVGNDVVDQLSKFDQLLDEMIDNGFPLTTEPNIMREMIAPPNIVNKMLSVMTGNSSNMSDTLPGATSSCIPWRTTDLKYANNEVYVDLVEEMDAIVNRDGVLVKCEIYGEVEVNSYLSGVPDLTLSFANPSILDDVRFHPCVRFCPWESQQILSFVPPDEQFKLISYR
ncbi:PREDICTED: AP-3 complex subunit [Prunus dulcis]|uniref:PREDICTED: AP-3 complex subunit n=1 Tax=Prunus dulcis TaxID=3755 RepID=A0A5E4GFI4_PRUDU|nr:PREDICTED: AP-3 complex subunit [Prunus dulcis]